MAEAIDSAYLPAAWKREELPEHPGFALYTEPRYGGMVTVDYNTRGYRIGLVCIGPLNSKKEYAGRGWRRRLEEDATAYLHAAVNT